ncbi:hypothetical protein [Actinoplanes sp. L3-i22]|uniref:hypothetical protein n=1 Tax=Actinoplanes sp. L3-i22 TaxID=2836373 RepID=UPI001C77C568|nr:hypothetical protein [Actinoplanes sp. L3-i22]BCY08977.1 hypothetical protein L3i22_040650 [Actinoplanes sp. L3-i22]
MRARRLHRATLAGLLVLPLLGVAGCGTDHPALTRDEATQQSQRLVQDIAQVFGQAEVINPKTLSVSCDSLFGNSGEVRYISGAFNIQLSLEADAATFRTVRDHWTGLGWKVVEDQYKQETRSGAVSLKDPDDGTNFTLVSTNSPHLLAVLSSSACYRETDRGDRN